MVTAGGFSSVAIDEADQVYTWGDCGRGQLGHGDKVRRMAPAIVMEPLLENQPKPDIRDTFRARAVVAGPSYMIGVVHREGKDSEEKWSWGDNSHGQLAMPYCNFKKRKAESHKLKQAPEKIPFLSKYKFKEISCGLEHGMAVVDLNVDKPGIGIKRTTDNGDDLLRVEKLEEILQKLLSGEVEEQDEKQGNLLDKNMDDSDDALSEEEGFESDEEDELDEKLNYPRQIYDHVHPVMPIVKRLGLSDEISELFDDQGIKLDTFIDLSESDLMEMGVSTLGARRRILRAIELLKSSQVIPDDEAETFVPEEYTDEQQKDLHPMEDNELDDYEGMDQIEEEAGEQQTTSPWFSMPFISG
eukprot:CAMPEP_0113668508 /NCGR_PEP_ID=MMETSP0038_2-20120614/4043_1 /TAXON_ID=2898 /ORGANISM="Cryptomonas paramecium" /LENGTH=356 /DNA_ID=CAMNT_0000584267 /DNA_START=250 /DNA_END=1316 /DNA_ORIENTATION=- /assembly_acc=CAM_ASM_000170